MKLPSDLLDQLTRTCKVANLLGINEIVMQDCDKGKIVRGMTDVGTPVVILHEFDLDMEFKDVAIRDAKSFLAKLELAEDRDTNYRVFINIDQDKLSVASFEFKGSKFNMKFAAGSERAVRSPKSLKDMVIARFQMETDAINTLNRATKAMVGDFVTFVCDGEEVSFEIKTASKDIFTYTFTDRVSAVDGDEPSFACSYPVKALISIVKNSDDNWFNIGERGILNTQIQQINVHLIPRV